MVVVPHLTEQRQQAVEQAAPIRTVVSEIPVAQAAVILVVPLVPGLPGKVIPGGQAPLENLVKPVAVEVALEALEEVSHHLLAEVGRPME